MCCQSVFIRSQMQSKLTYPESIERFAANVKRSATRQFVLSKLFPSWHSEPSPAYPFLTNVNIICFCVAVCLVLAFERDVACIMYCRVKYNFSLNNLYKCGKMLLIIVIPAIWMCAKYRPKYKIAPNKFCAGSNSIMLSAGGRGEMRGRSRHCGLRHRGVGRAHEIPWRFGKPHWS